MPDLHEQHETLKRRGMSACLMLVFVAYVAPTDGNLGYWMLDGNDILEAPARDLITMHALQWCRDSEELKYLRFMDTPDGWMATGEVELSESSCWGNPEWNPQVDDTALDAILAATKHLEPANVD